MKPINKPRAKRKNESRLVIAPHFCPWLFLCVAKQRRSAFADLRADFVATEHLLRHYLFDAVVQFVTNVRGRDESVSNGIGSNMRLPSEVK
jgi:hypothetical protein